MAAAEELAQTGECNADDIYRYPPQNIFMCTHITSYVLYTQIYAYTNIPKHIHGVTGEYNTDDI